MAVLAMALLCLARAADYNVVNVDNASFPLLVGQKLPVFLRFDGEYPYGAKADAFKAVAALVARSGKPLLAPRRS